MRKFIAKYQNSSKYRGIIKGIGIAGISLLIGSFFSEMVSDWLDENYRITSKRLAGLLKSDKIQEFNELRKQTNEYIEFDGIDLSRRNLEDANLKSLSLTNVNLSNANLENSHLENLKVSGDLSKTKMNNADLSRSDFLILTFPMLV